MTGVTQKGQSNNESFEGILCGSDMRKTGEHSRESLRLP